MKEVFFLLVLVSIETKNRGEGGEGDHMRKPMTPWPSGFHWH